MRLLAIACLAACGGGGGQSPTPDADIPDAAPGDLVFHRYVIDEQRVPLNNSEARVLGLDLDDDDVIDNQLGMVFGALAGQGFDTQGLVAAAISTGETIALVELGTENNFQAGAGSFELFAGTNPSPPACTDPSDPVCRRHLDGSGSFDVDATAPRNAAIAGSFENNTFTTLTAGRLRVAVPILTASPLTLDLIGARVRVMATSISIMEGVVAGGVTQNQLELQVLPQMQASFLATVEEDCTGAPQPAPCGCEPASTGRTLLGLFDTDPADCFISVSEVRNNSLIQSLLAPDITIQGQPALSFGMAIRAVPGTFTP